MSQNYARAIPISRKGLSIHSFHFLELLLLCHLGPYYDEFPCPHCNKLYYGKVLHHSIEGWARTAGRLRLALVCSCSRWSNYLYFYYIYVFYHC